MLYIKGGFKDDRVMFFGKTENLADAIRFQDNIIEVFSQGLRPQTVIVSIVNEFDNVVITTEGYNGYFMQVYADETLAEIYS